MVDLNDVIAVLESTYCRDHMQDGVALSAASINPILAALGGRPVCVDDSLPGAGDGSELHHVMLYAIALLARKVQA